MIVALARLGRVHVKAGPVGGTCVAVLKLGGMYVETDLLDLYRRSSEWTMTKSAGSRSRLDAATPCDEWDVRTLLNHMLDTQRYFTRVARGEDSSPPAPTPPELIGDDPVAAFERTRADALRAFGKPGVIEQTGPSLGIAFSDQLLHGWDLA